MKTMFNTSAKLAKGAAAILAAGALVMGSASPAAASDDRRGRGGPSAGEIIAGVAVIGGIAALAGAFDGNRGRDRWDDGGWRGHDGYRGGFRGGNRGLVESCARNVEIEVRRRSGWRAARVTEIRRVDRTRDGFRVRGVVEVRGGPGFSGRNFDRGRFNCFVNGRGRPFVEFGGIRGLR